MIFGEQEIQKADSRVLLPTIYLVHSRAPKGGMTPTVTYLPSQSRQRLCPARSLDQS